LCENGKQLLLV